MPEPLKEGYYVRLVGAAVPSEYIDKYYQVVAVEGFTYETGQADTAEFTSVASGSESGFKNITVLEPDDKPFHLYYVKWGVRDGCEYQIKIPTGTNRLGLDEDMDVARIDNEKSPWYDPNPEYAFFLIHDMYPAINAINNTPSSVTPKVWFEGEKYDLAEVTDPDVLEKLRRRPTYRARR